MKDYCSNIQNDGKRADLDRIVLAYNRLKSGSQTTESMSSKSLIELISQSEGFGKEEVENTLVKHLYTQKVYGERKATVEYVAKELGISKHRVSKINYHNGDSRTRLDDNLKQLVFDAYSAKIGEKNRFTVKDIAKMHKMSESTVYKIIRDGKAENRVKGRAKKADNANNSIKDRLETDIPLKIDMKNGDLSAYPEMRLTGFYGRKDYFAPNKIILAKGYKTMRENTTASIDLVGSYSPIDQERQLITNALTGRNIRENILLCNMKKTEKPKKTSRILRYGKKAAIAATITIASMFSAFYAWDYITGKKPLPLNNHSQVQYISNNLENNHTN